MADMQDIIKAVTHLKDGIQRAHDNGYKAAISVIPMLKTELEVLQKELPEKPVLGMYGKHAVWTCPSCGAYMLNPERTVIAEYKHCPECGQKLDWEVDSCKTN